MYHVKARHSDKSHARPAANVNAADLTLSDIQTSYATYTTFIPYAGILTVDGPEIRKLWVRFNETSPGTGDVEISFDGVHYVGLNIASLLELI